jgi:hypothetical protein
MNSFAKSFLLNDTKETLTLLYGHKGYIDDTNLTFDQIINSLFLLLSVIIMNRDKGE